MDGLPGGGCSGFRRERHGLTGLGRAADRVGDAERLQGFAIRAADAVLSPANGVDEVAILPPDRVALGVPVRPAAADIDHDVVVGHLDGAPLAEEILFRGFLLPAFAIAYDWLCLPRTEAARASWQSSNALTRNSLIFSTVLTSTLFALVHGKQTAFTWPILALLFAVSLILGYGAR